MDILKEAALAYKNLLKKEYVIVVGKNNKSRSYVLQFTSDEFKHICGLHKLKDNLDIYRSSSSALLNKIIKDKITIEDINKSKKYPEIEERIKNIAHIQEYLDNFDVIYDWEQKNSRFSIIDANLMIPIKSAELNGYESYIFFKNSERNGTLELSDYIVEPHQFSRLETAIVDKKDYREGQTRPPALLYKEKIELSDDSKKAISRKELYVADSFRKELEEMKDAGEITRSDSALSPTCSDGGSNNTQYFSIEHLNGQRFSTSPFALAGAEVTQSASADFPPPIDIGALIDALKFLNEKLNNFLHKFRSPLEQSGATRERKINAELPFSNPKPTEPVTEVQEPEVKPIEKRSSWIENLISSARSESNAHNKSHEPKAHDKNKSL